MGWILYFFKKNFVFFSENDCLWLESLFWKVKSRNHPFRKEEVRSRVIASTYNFSKSIGPQIADYGGNIRIFFCLHFNEAKAPTLWTTLALWILNISMTVTGWTDCHTIFPRVKNLLFHFSLPTNYQPFQAI
jgi:hypothetical protein